MGHVNYEFKARLKDEARIRRLLRRLRARFVGTDRQVDTYFCVPRGRLKVREGRIENSLIYYERSNAPRLRPSLIKMMLLPRRNRLRPVLAAALGVRARVDKRREIYFVGNVKIHLDRVKGLGNFVEVEAISRRGGTKKIRAQARRFRELFAIPPSDIVGESYSDLVLRKMNH